MIKLFKGVLLVVFIASLSLTLDAGQQAKKKKVEIKTLTLEQKVDRVFKTLSNPARMRLSISPLLCFLSSTCLRTKNRNGSPTA